MNRSDKCRLKNRTQINVYVSKDIIKKAVFESYNDIKDLEKKEEQKHVPTNFLKASTYMIFLVFKVIMGIFSVVFFAVPFELKYTNMLQDISTCFLSIIIGILCITFVFMYHITGKAIDKETDKFYVIAFFSSMVSFSALLISLIGLLKGIQ